MSQKKRNATIAASPALVHVLHGVYEHHLPLAGKSVLEAKIRLPFQLPIFAHALVNDRPVLVHHMLKGGDTLAFILPPGFKAAGKRKRIDEKMEAEGLLSAYPELVKIANTIKHEAKAGNWDRDKIIETMMSMVARWCEDHFGTLPRAVMATVNEVVAQLGGLGDRASRMRHGERPQKLGRKNTTRELADFADSLHPEHTWKDIAAEWNKKHLGATVTHHKARDAWRRRYGDKALPKNLRGES